MSEVILAYEYGKITERMSSGEQIKISVLGSLPSFGKKIFVFLVVNSVLTLDSNINSFDYFNLNDFKKDLKYLLFIFCNFLSNNYYIVIKILNLILKSLNYLTSPFISVPLVLLGAIIIQSEKQISKYILPLFIFCSLVRFIKI